MEGTARLDYLCMLPLAYLCEAENLAVQIKLLVISSYRIKRRK
jgi:hypothetical protein